MDKSITRMQLNDLTYKISDSIFKVHTIPGPGCLERVYQATLIYELKNKLQLVSQVGLPVDYNDVILELGFRIENQVEDQIIIEVKSIEALHDVHKRQLPTYFMLSGKKIWTFGEL